MTIVKAIDSSCGLTCCDCLHFVDDPAEIEAQLPKIGILGSAFGSTRGNAGICRELDRFHDQVPAESCPWFAPKVPGGTENG